MPTTPQYTSPGGVVVPASNGTADVVGIARGMLDGTTGGSGLNTQTIPTFASLGALTAAYPSPTPGNTPPMAQVWASGMPAGTLYRYNPAASAWTPIAGYAGGDSATPPSAVSPIAPGETRDILNITVAAAAAARRVTVAAAALIGYSSTSDGVDLILRVNSNPVRNAVRGAPSMLTSTIELSSYTFTCPAGSGFSLQTLYFRRAGSSGTCSVNLDARFTHLSYEAWYV